MSEVVKKSENKLLSGIKAALLSLVFPLVSIIVALFIAVLLVMWGNKIDFISGAQLLFTTIWRGSFGTKDNLIETFVYVTPLLFTGLANAVAFKTGLFNIGVEGQFTVGVLTCAVVGLIPGIPRFIHLPLVIISGAAAGALWGAVPGYLKAKVGTNEVVNTIMMNYIAMYLTNYIVMGPLNKPGVASTAEIRPSAMLWRFVNQNQRINTGIFIALVVVLLVYILFWKTTIGYEIRAVGLNPYAAEYGGIDIKKNMILAMVISGGIAGLGGSVYVSGIQHNALQLAAFIGYGFDGIAVALLAKNHPVGIIFSAILFGALNTSSIQLQLVNIPKQIVYLIQSIIIIFVAADYIYRWIGEKRKKEAMINE